MKGINITTPSWAAYFYEIKILAQCCISTEITMCLMVDRIEKKHRDMIHYIIVNCV